MENDYMGRMMKLMSMLGREPGIAQPPGAYGQPEYAPNAGPEVTPSAPPQQEQGIMEMLQMLMEERRKKKMMEQEAAGRAEAQGSTNLQQADQAARAQEQQLMERPLPQPAQGSAVAPPAQNFEDGPQGAGTMRDMQIQDALRRSGAL
jgi:hypothetical protein